MKLKLQYNTIKNIAFIILGAVFFSACTNNNSIKDWEEINKSTKPKITGKNIEIKQSRNGIVQFRAFINDIVEEHKDDNPYIYICPNGIHIWQYDSISNTNFELTADSAYIIKPEEYYELWGNVTIERKQDSTLAVMDRLFIEQKKNSIHTDSEIIINKLKHLKDVTASGFQSDLAFENPVFYNITKGDIDYQNLRLKKRKDSISTNTLSNKETTKQ